MAPLELFQISKFPGNSNRYTTPERVNISASGMCGFNKTAAQNFLFRPGKFVKIWYDRQTRIIGFELFGRKDDDALIIGKNGSLNLNKLFWYFKLDAKKIGGGSYELIEDGAIFKIYLDKKLVLWKVK